MDLLDGSSNRRLRVGISISLTGQYAGLALPAFQAVQMWTERAGAELVYYDDASRVRRAIENVQRLLGRDRVNILLGPYSSALAGAVANVANEHRRVLWNHGGSSDDIAGPWIVSIPTPASQYFVGLPGWLAGNAPGRRTITVMRSHRGSFSRHVAQGLARAAEAAGYRIQHLSLDEALPPSADVLVLAGSFEQDVQIIKSRPAAAIIAAVAAGVAAFDDELGPLAEGVLGPSQWEPDGGADGFAREFEERFGRPPDYIAAGAFATGLIIEMCIRQARSMDDRRLRAAATELDVETFYGQFRIDAATGRQLGHQMLLVRWVAGRKVTCHQE